MKDDFDEFVESLQSQIYDDARATYGEIVFERWRNPLHIGPIENPDGHARITGPCGDTMEIFLKFEESRVKKASFQTNGCGASVACGSFAAEMAFGKSPDELLEVTGEAILEKVGGLPEEDRHCAFLAGETLQEALNDYMIKQNP